MIMSTSVLLFVNGFFFFFFFVLDFETSLKESSTMEMGTMLREKDDKDALNMNSI